MAPDTGVVLFGITENLVPTRHTMTWAMNRGREVGRGRLRIKADASAGLIGSPQVVCATTCSHNSASALRNCMYAEIFYGNLFHIRPLI